MLSSHWLDKDFTYMVTVTLTFDPKNNRGLLLAMTNVFTKFGEPRLRKSLVMDRTRFCDVHTYVRTDVRTYGQQQRYMPLTFQVGAHESEKLLSRFQKN